MGGVGWVSGTGYLTYQLWLQLLPLLPATANALPDDIWAAKRLAFVATMIYPGFVPRLWRITESRTTVTWRHFNHERVAQHGIPSTKPRWGIGVSCFFPRVAAARQPWAILRKPFGLSRNVASLGNWLMWDRARHQAVLGRREPCEDPPRSRIVPPRYSCRRERHSGAIRGSRSSFRTPNGNAGRYRLMACQAPVANGYNRPAVRIASLFIGSNGTRRVLTHRSDWTIAGKWEVWARYSRFVQCR
jgi:hypothetical protein